MTQTMINYLQSYWGIIATILGFIVYAVFQRENAKKIILSIMLRLEKEAENLALETGDAKLEFISEKGYLLLPANVRLFITEASFKSLVKSLYDKAKQYLIVAKPKVVEVIAPVETVAIAETVTPDTVAVDSVVVTDPIAPVSVPSPIQPILDAATAAGQIAYQQVLQDSIQALSVTK